jgi:type I restriction enzyme M protein
MLAPQLRQQIFSLWTAFWSSGMSNPITSIEQITYLLFLKQIEQLDAEHVKNSKRSLYETDEEQLLRWSALQTAENPYERLTQKIFPWLRTLGDTIDARWRDDKDKKLEVTNYLEDAFFQLPKEKTGTLRIALDSVNELFDNTKGQNGDLMGDIFEYLLDQLSTSGKNGQFRTPRHLIRFMIELLEPEEGKRILDPAGGTAGFLTNTVLYHKQKRTPPEQLKLEWDGTPHQLDTTYRPSRQEFTGFDNDRTMVRIGWMNMILHGISNPRYEQKDPLGRGFNEPPDYDYVFANPPYSGNVDISDLNPRFPRKDEKPIRPNETEEEKIKRETALEKKDPITDSSELLFVWLLLRLLKPKGKMAVIVPEGLLFGSTSAHRLLRRTLIYDNIVEGVISLPQGVFNPYTGVKTSILIVTKGDSKPNTVTSGIEEPKTKKVWFYEIASDGFTLGSNRNPQPLKDNDLWDALEKWHKRHKFQSVADARENVYYQPEKFLQRWRKVDENLASYFTETKGKKGQILGIQEIFRQLKTNYPQPLDITKAEENTVNESLSLLAQLFKRFYVQTQKIKIEDFKPIDLTKINFEDFKKKFRTWILQHDKKPSILEQSDQKSSYFEMHGRALLDTAIDKFFDQKTHQDILKSFTKEELEKLLTQEAEAVKSKEDRVRDNLPPAPSELLERFAKLDGYNIFLRSLEVHRQTEKLTEPKSWTVDVRLWREQLDWKVPPRPEPKVKKGAEPKSQAVETSQVVGSHDQKGKLRPEYIEAALGKDQYLNSDFLESECIEANDFNLSANRYKPLQLTSDAVDAGTTAKQLRELLEMEDELRLELQKLLDMVEGKV